LVFCALVEHPQVLAQGNEGRQLVMHLSAERVCRALRHRRDLDDGFAPAHAGGGRPLNFLDSVVRTSRRAKIQLGGEARDKTHLAMNLLLLLALAVPLSGLAFLSLLALLGLMTLGAVIHVLGTVRAR
jgi:hypothetical protein